MENNATKRQDERLSVTCSVIDLLPVDVVGTILSYVSCARDVARASATCCKWREAAKCHIHKLKFLKTDLRFMETSRRTLVITEAVMQAEHLSDLSISCFNFALPETVLIALLQHTKRTLKSLTLRVRINPELNILEKLARYGCSLECLGLKFACLSGLNPRIHSLPSLVSLNLKSMPSLKYEDFCLLFSILPKLEYLSLKDFRINNCPSVVKIYHTSLKTLSMEKLWSSIINLVVHGSNFESLSLVNMRCDNLSWGQIEGSVHVRNLSIRSSTLQRLVLPEGLQSLVLWDTSIAQLETGFLGSLLKLKLVETRKGLTLARPKYSQVISMASSGMKELHMLGNFPGSADIVDVHIASAFPHLHTLSVDFHNSFFGKSPQQPPLAYKKVVVLELHTFVQHTRHELFTDWIVKMMSHYPSLKRLVLVLEGHDPGRRFFAAIIPLLINHMHARPHIDVKFKFDNA